MISIAIKKVEINSEILVICLSEKNQMLEIVIAFSTRHLQTSLHKFAFVEKIPRWSPITLNIVNISNMMEPVENWNWIFIITKTNTQPKRNDLNMSKEEKRKRKKLRKENWWK